MTYGGRERNRERERNRVRERETRKKRELRVALGSLSLEAKKNFCLGLSSNASHSSKAQSEEEKGKHRLFLSLSLFSRQAMENHLLRHGEAMEAELKAAGEVSLGVSWCLVFCARARASPASRARHPTQGSVLRAHRAPRRVWVQPKSHTRSHAPFQCTHRHPHLSLSPHRQPSWPSPTTAASS